MTKAAIRQSLAQADLMSAKGSDLPLTTFGMGDEPADRPGERVEPMLPELRLP